MAQCMISAPQPEAVEAGLRIFENGGNVIDAAIGAAMVQTVVDPQMCGIAGFGAMRMISKLVLKQRKDTDLGMAEYAKCAASPKQPGLF